MGGKISVARKDIPDDILADILNRLPVKSLARLRSVSKKWRSIISDPLFVKPLLNPNRRHLLFFSASHLKSLPLDEPIPSSPPTGNLTCPLKPVLESTKILGSCNGMVCLTCSTEFYVWNPTTGFLRRLPEPRFPLTHENILYHGFGYCSATDDYKVVVAGLRYDHLHNYYYRETEVMLFSWRAGVWRTIESPLKGYVPHSGAYLWDTLHWLQQADRPICAFDLVEEEFQTMPEPHFVVYGNQNSYCKCDSWGGNLYVFRRRFLGDWEYVDEAIELWVMREYGVDESWNKLCDFEFSHVVYLPQRSVVRCPFLVLGESGTVLVVASLVSKMPYGMMIRREGKQFVVNVAGESSSGVSHMIVYEESLLQLPEYRVPTKPKSRGIIARCKCCWGLESGVAGTSA